MEAGAEIEDTHPDFGVQGIVVSRKTRPFPAAAVHPFSQWEKEKYLKAMAFTPWSQP